MKAGTCQEGRHLGGSLKDRTHHDTLLRIIRKADAIATIIETIECRGSELCLLDDLQCPRRESEVHKAIGNSGNSVVVLSPPDRVFHIPSSKRGLFLSAPPH